MITNQVIYFVGQEYSGAKMGYWRSDPIFRQDDLRESLSRWLLGKRGHLHYVDTRYLVFFVLIICKTWSKLQSAVFNRVRDLAYWDRLHFVLIGGIKLSVDR